MKYEFLVHNLLYAPLSPRRPFMLTQHGMWRQDLLLAEPLFMTMKDWSWLVSPVRLLKLLALLSSCCSEGH
ncbi:hypothetical protein J1N35_039319 [Gossypium stocksii]|uniref:Uncharacterized protein n=1 Tax=Gossypium stocksii TaxID=47602 RepID=A0A9D3UNL5_9ROSI|nr:hypothetical protein J1N35_039319 [Gossypium stocksii]